MSLTLCLSGSCWAGEPLSACLQPRVAQLHLGIKPHARDGNPSFLPGAIKSQQSGEDSVRGQLNSSWQRAFPSLTARGLDTLSSQRSPSALASAETVPRQPLWSAIYILYMTLTGVSRKRRKKGNEGKNKGE